MMMRLRFNKHHLTINNPAASIIRESVTNVTQNTPGRVAQSVGHLTGKSEALGSIPGLATYFRFSFC